MRPEELRAARLEKKRAAVASASGEPQRLAESPHEDGASSSSLQDDRSDIAPHSADNATSNMGQLLDALESGAIEIAMAPSQARPEAARDDASHGAAVSSSPPASKFCEGASLPLDFSVKHSARYQSYDLDFAWARQLCHARASPRALFASALVCFCCDGEAWKAAFRAAYFALRCGELETLYLRTRDFTVLWRGGPQSPDASDRATSTAAVAWQRPCEAWVNRTTRALRKALRDADVTFALPLDLAGKLAAEDRHEEGTAKAARARNARWHGAASLARVCGHLEVGGLFEVLTCGDVPLGPAPMLLSPSPFQGATLTAATITFAGAVTVAAGAESRSQERVEISGTFLPCAVRKQCDALARLALDKGRRSTFSAKYKTFEDTAAFSRCAPLACV